MSAPVLSIPEEAIDRHIRRVVEFAGDSDTRLKYACIAASPVVGSYDGTTAEIARQIHRSVSTVENYAHAHWLYRELRANGNRRRVRQLWRALPASHWWLAYDIQRGGYDSFYYLSNAELHGWSGRAMCGEWRKEMESGNAPLILPRMKVAIRGLASELLKHHRLLNERQYNAVQEILEAFDE